MKTFQYVKPDTIEGLMEVLKDTDGYSLLAGGTDLLVQINEGKKTPNVLVDIKGIQEFFHLKTEGNYLSIGANVTLNQVATFPVIRQRIPFLSDAAHSVGSMQVRNRATLVGNLCNASPAADTATVLMVLDGEMEILGPSGNRKVKVEDFFLGPGLSILEKGEMVGRVLIPVPDEPNGGAFIKHSRRSMVDLSSVNVAVMINNNDQIKIALGAVAPTPIRIKNAEEFLNKYGLTPNNCKEAVNMVADEIKPISDIRASKEYRVEMVKVHVQEAIEKALSIKKGRRKTL